MARQGLRGRCPKRKRRSLTRPGQAPARVPDLENRDFRADQVDQRWCGDLTEIPTEDASSTWPPSWTWRRGGSRIRPWASITTPASPGPRCAWPPRSGAAGSPASCSTQRPRRRVQRRRVRPGVRRARGGPIDGTGRGPRSTTPRRRASTPPSSGSCYPGGASPPTPAAFIDAYNHRRRHSSCEMMPSAACEQLLAARAVPRSSAEVAAWTPSRARTCRRSFGVPVEGEAQVIDLGLSGCSVVAGTGSALRRPGYEGLVGRSCWARSAIRSGRSRCTSWLAPSTGTRSDEVERPAQWACPASQI